MTFHHFLQLSAADQDLHWALGLCFVCGKEKHRAECCPRFKAHGPLFCGLLPDPYREWFMCFGFCSLSDMIVFSELDCVRPRHAGNPPFDEEAWGLKSPSSGGAWGVVDDPWFPPEASEESSSVPSLVPVSDESLTSSSLWGASSLEEFERDVDKALEGVEGDVGGVLMGFVDDVVVRGGEVFDIRSQVAFRSAGPPGLEDEESSVDTDSLCGDWMGSLGDRRDLPIIVE